MPLCGFFSSFFFFSIVYGGLLLSSPNVSGSLSLVPVLCFHSLTEKASVFTEFCFGCFFFFILCVLLALSFELSSVWKAPLIILYSYSSLGFSLVFGGGLLRYLDFI